MSHGYTNHSRDRNTLFTSLSSTRGASGRFGSSAQGTRANDFGRQNQGERTSQTQRRDDLRGTRSSWEYRGIQGSNGVTYQNDARISIVAMIGQVSSSLEFVLNLEVVQM